jgi:hypothetical protein
MIKIRSFLLSRLIWAHTQADDPWQVLVRTGTRYLGAGAGLGPYKKTAIKHAFICPMCNRLPAQSAVCTGMTTVKQGIVPLSVPLVNRPPVQSAACVFPILTEDFLVR